MPVLLHIKLEQVKRGHHNSQRGKYICHVPGQKRRHRDNEVRLCDHQYGRDAAGGTVNINFNRPHPTNETDVQAEVGNYALWHITGVQNSAINDRLMVRAAVDVDKHNGYLSNDSDDLASTAARLSYSQDTFLESMPRSKHLSRRIMTGSMPTGSSVSRLI